MSERETFSLFSSPLKTATVFPLISFTTEFSYFIITSLIFNFASLKIPYILPIKIPATTIITSKIKSKVIPIIFLAFECFFVLILYFFVLSNSFSVLLLCTLFTAFLELLFFFSISLFSFLKIF